MIYLSTMDISYPLMQKESAKRNAEQESITGKYVTKNIYISCMNFAHILHYMFLGKDTTHCTNGIIIQRKINTCALPPTMVADRYPSKKRSITYITTNMLPYSRGRREGPSQIHEDITSQMFQENNALSASA